MILPYIVAHTAIGLFRHARNRRAKRTALDLNVSASVGGDGNTRSD